MQNRKLLSSDHAEGHILFVFTKTMAWSLPLSRRILSSHSSLSRMS